MKTLAIAALLAALALTGSARAGDALKTEPTKPAVKKVTTEELGGVLQRLGYAPRPVQNKDGRVIGYRIEVNLPSGAVPASVHVTPSGNVWISTNLGVFDDKTSAGAEVLYALLATHDDLWPAYLVYTPETKSLELRLPLEAAGYSPAALRAKLESMKEKLVIVATAYMKAAEQKNQSR